MLMIGNGRKTKIDLQYKLVPKLTFFFKGKQKGKEKEMKKSWFDSFFNINNTIILL